MIIFSRKLYQKIKNVNYFRQKLSKMITKCNVLFAKWYLSVGLFAKELWLRVLSADISGVKRSLLVGMFLMLPFFVVSSLFFPSVGNLFQTFYRHRFHFTAKKKYFYRDKVKVSSRQSKICIARKISQCLQRKNLRTTK